MYSVFVLLFCLAAAIAQQTPPVGVLKHVIVTYRAPQHTACDYLPDLTIAGRKESESELTDDGKRAAFYFGQEISNKYKPLLSVSDWDKEGWSFGTFTKRTQNAALMFASGLKHLENDKFKDWTQDERDAIKYEEVKDFLKFQNLKECPGFLKSLSAVKSQVGALAANNKEAVGAVAQKYNANPAKPYQFWIAYETFLNQKAAKELDPDMEAQLPGLKAFSQGLLFTSTSTDELKKKAGGRLLDDILKDLEATKNGKPLTAVKGKENAKASFFAAPQDVLAAQLAVFNPEGTTYGGQPLTAETFYPEHGAAHIIELHQMNRDKSWMVRVLYRQNSRDDFKAARLPGCGGALCDYDTFVKAVQGFRQTKQQLEADCA